MIQPLRAACGALGRAALLAPLLAAASGPVNPAESAPACKLSNGVQHVIYVHFDNTHVLRDPGTGCRARRRPAGAPSEAGRNARVGHEARAWLHQDHSENQSVGMPTITASHEGKFAPIHACHSGERLFQTSTLRVSWTGRRSQTDQS